MIRAVLAFAFCTHAFAAPPRLPPTEPHPRSTVSRRATGYAILVAAMVASAAAATSLGGRLPPSARFLSHFISQVSTLGVYVFGAPIWEPLGSGFRKLAFGVEGEAGGEDALETMWRRTQYAYSLNEQMSRNVVTSFLTSVRQNFYEARRAVVTRDPGYAVDQVAEAAVRLHRHFADISPGDAAVATAVHAAFTDHVDLPADFRARVRAAIARLDARADVDGPRYAAVLDAWLD